MWSKLFCYEIIELVEADNIPHNPFDDRLARGRLNEYSANKNFM